MNEKQRIFADEYLIDFNATQSAIRAGYSKKTAYSHGQRLLKNVEVKSYIDERLEKIRSEKIADSREVIEFLTSIMRDENQCSGVRVRSAELIGKRYALFRVNHDVSIPIPVIITGEDDLED